jgi:hypothetical protein
MDWRERLKFISKGNPLEGMEGVLPSQAVEWRRSGAKEGCIVSGFMRACRFID